jgi:hypothetical protein
MRTRAILVLAHSLSIALAAGCSSSSGGGSRSVSTSVPGSTGAFVVQVYNGAQLPIAVNVTAGSVTTATLEIALGQVGDFDVGSQPQSFTVNASTVNTTAYQYPPLTETLGQNYKPTDTSVLVSFYQQPTPGAPGAQIVPTTTTPTGTPAQLIVQSGNGQSAPAGSQLPQPLVVEAVDQNNNPVAGVTITFAITGGNGTLSAQSAVTNSAGLAQVTLTLDPAPGTNTVDATTTTPPLGPVTFSEQGM